MKYYSEQEYLEAQGMQNSFNGQTEIDFGCNYCWDLKKKKEKELFFLDKANNMRICNYCPNCGRKYGD